MRPPPGSRIIRPRREEEASVEIRLERDEIAVEVERISGQNIMACYQCGACTASCPVASSMDLRPNQVMRLLQLGKSEDVLRALTPWICASCYNCQVECPRGIKVTSVMYALRELALKRGLAPRGAMGPAFVTTFLGQVLKRGRVHEAPLMTLTALKSRPLSLLPKAPLGLRLFLKRRMPLVGEKVRRIREIETIRRGLEKGRQG